MPKIYKPEKKSYKRINQSSKKDNNINKYIYNTTTWRKLRIEKLKLNPLCERCLAKDIIKSGVDIHHKIPISSGDNIFKMMQLGFDFQNLQTLCEDCHKEVHNNTNTFE